MPKSKNKRTRGRYAGCRVLRAQVKVERPTEVEEQALTQDEFEAWLVKSIGEQYTQAGEVVEVARMLYGSVNKHTLEAAERYLCQQKKNP